MQSGALAFIDALGFKGIWQRTDPEELLDKLRQTLRHTQATVDDWNDLPAAKEQRVSQKAAFLSDTVVIGVEVADVPEHVQYSAKAVALRTLLIHVVELLRSSASTEPPIAYRGCITIGEFIIDDRFILGPAVDRAAMYERQAEGAFVWLDPEARTLVENDPMLSDANRLTRMGLHPYRVPLKQGKRFDTYVVVPFIPEFVLKEGTEVAERILSTFNGPALDVVIKRDNTKRFLNEAIEAVNARLAAR